MDQALISFLDLNPRLKYRIRVVNTGYGNITRARRFLTDSFPDLLLGLVSNLIIGWI
jgi:hypothetical protein